MNIFNQLKTDIINTGKQLGFDESLLLSASIELPKGISNGDLSTNVAMIIASNLKKNPKEVAESFKEELSKLSYISSAAAAGPGFINFSLKPKTWYECLQAILDKDADYLEVDTGNNQNVNIEYVSANPTGPLHIGHARGAVYGDALANLLKKAGYRVTKEFYVNDAGSQIDTLTDSTFLRYEEAVTGKPAIIPEGYYPGEYLVSVGQKLKAKYADDLLSMPIEEAKKIIRKFAIEEMLELIKSDLKDIGVEHDIFFSEQSLHDSRKIESAVEKLKSLGLIYNGVLPAPKGKVDEDWEEREQLLFKSTDYGDDQDRPIQKTDGTWTYLAADFAYAENKIDRGFNHLVYILGADHGGYIKRIKATVEALSNGKVTSDVKICQLVNFMSSGVPVKMSKRSGTFTTVRDVINEVEQGIIRFIMLTRKNDATLDFDLEKVKEQSKDNPVFYTQYACVRALSIINNSEDICPLGYEKFKLGKYDLSLLSSHEEMELIKLLVSWPKVIEASARQFEPHRIAFYAINLASSFHSLWNLGKENNNYRFVIVNDIDLTAARLALVSVVREIICQAFDIIGVKPLDKM